jgi:hypothetical protein
VRRSEKGRYDRRVRGVGVLTRPEYVEVPERDTLDRARASEGQNVLFSSELGSAVSTFGRVGVSP